ncbi:YerC/YecD family TrpR-related protein [Eubacterium aggregans]|uniref:YerC/YecD family TrpR-related protein n=1 Tax=Eubacterium aggregans TaxID=81409 RepID=UPI003F3A6D6A
MDTKLKDLATAIMAIEDEQECLSLLDDMCTIKEVDDMANRFHIALLLYAGKTFNDVENTTGASSATISRVNRSLKHGTGYRTITERMTGEAYKK